jgi:Peptidase family M23
MKKILFCIVFFWIAYAVNAQKNKAAVTDPKFFMPMSDVVSLKYYDKNNHACDEYDYSQVIFSSKDSSVYSVTEGEVTTVDDVEDMKVVIVVNGKLFVTYSNLKSVLVKKGDKIKIDQMIGYAALDLDEVMPTLDFYLSNTKNTIKLSSKNFKPRVNDNSKDHSFDPVNDPE